MVIVVVEVAVVVEAAVVDMEVVVEEEEDSTETEVLYKCTILLITKYIKMLYYTECPSACH